MATAIRENFLGAGHAVAGILNAFDVHSIVRLKETRPADAGIEFRADEIAAIRRNAKWFIAKAHRA